MSPYDWIDPQLMDIHQKHKHQRVMAIAKLIRDRGGVNYRKFLAEMQYHGIRDKVADEYIRILKDLGMIRREKDDLVFNENSDYWKRFGLTRTPGTCKV